ncbi:MAG: hypothetical protein ACTSYI_05910 [Promethearchaeota archaeon]
MADIQSILGQVDSYFAMIILPAMVFVLFRRNIKQYRDTSSWNWVRTLLALAITTDFSQTLIKLLYRTYDIAFLAGIMTKDANGSSPMDFSFGFIVMFGIILTAYLNRRDEFLLFSVFFQIGTIIIYYTTGYIQFEEYFVYIFGVVALLSLYETGFRVKDNNGLGFAIFYTMQFSVIFELGMIGTIISITAYIFGFLLAIGLFRPFGKEDF